MIGSILKFYPKIINQILESKKDSFDSFYYTLFADISGFTQISESLMSSGFEGAEKIRDILNNHFHFFSKTIYSNGGDILQYSGDAILSIFPSFESAKETMELIIDFTRKSGVLSIRGGISYGEINFKIFKFNGGYLLLSQGEAVETSMKAEQKSDIMGFVSATEERKALENLLQNYTLPISVDKSISEVFDLFNLEYGSFAFASILFLFVQEKDIPIILKLAENRIYINKIEKYPEGIRIFLLSGVLNLKGNPVESMLEFVHDLGKLSISKSIFGGVSSGYIFNGFTGSNERCEYNLIGKSINRTARIASKAKLGEILFDKEILEESSSASGQFIRSENLKGIGIVNLYRIKEYRKHSVPLYLPIFGREKEMEKIGELLEKSLVVKISGESGVGKTHLVSSYVYENIINALYLNISEADTLSENSILSMLNIEMNDNDNSEESLYGKFLNFMLNIKKDEVLIIDNFDKLDSCSVKILDRFLSESSFSKIILISSKVKGEIHLEPFDSKGIAGIIEKRTGIPPSVFLSDTLFKKTNGNPYFILAFFRSLISEGLVEMNYLAEWDLNKDKSIVSTDISSSVQMIFSSLSPLERNILKISSIFDFGCSEDILFKILHDTKFEIVSKTILELIQKNLLQKRERKISFVNDVVREHIYKSILTKEKNSFHRIAARVLASENELFEAGRHYYLSGENEKAKNLLSNYTELIAENRTGLSLYYAILLYDMTKSPKVLLDIINLLLKEGRFQEAENIFKKDENILDLDNRILLSARFLVFKGEREPLIDFVNKNLENIKDKRVIFSMLDEIAFAMAVSGNEGAAEYAHKAMKMIEDGVDVDIKRMKLGGTFRELGDYENVEKIYRLKYEKALSDNNSIEAYSALSDMISMMPPGRFTVEYTLDVNEKLLNLLKESDMKQEELKALKSLTMRLRDRGEYEKAMEKGLKGIDLARRLKNSTSEIVLLSQLGHMEFNKGELKRAIALFKEAEQIAERNGSFLLLESIYGNMGVCKHVEKDYGAAYELYEKALEISMKVKHSDTRFLWILNLALLGIESKQLENVDHYLYMAREELKKSKIEERWLDVEQIAANCAFLQGDFDKCILTSKRVLDEAMARTETEIYYETLPYYAGSLILRKNSDGNSLLKEAEEWAKEKNSENVKNNIEDVKKVLNSLDK